MNTNSTIPQTTVSSTPYTTATTSATTITVLPTTISNLTQTTTPLKQTTTNVLFTSTVSDLTTTVTSNGTILPSNLSEESGCLRILYEDVGTSRIRIWDVTLFVPNLLFLLFILYRFYTSRGRLHRNLGGSSPIFTTYFCLVLMTAVLSVIRCIVSMSVDVASTAGNEANKLLWVILRFFLLMAEMSVLVFGLACGHLDSKSSIKRVLCVTTFLALIYSITQGILEMLKPDPRYKVSEEKLTVYGHGGALFCFITSVVFLCVYVIVCLLPLCDCVKKFLTIPTKKSFYVYACFMAILYFGFALGSGLLYDKNDAGLCIQDAASLAYFILFTPFLYWTFLHSFFGVMQPSSVLFSYSAQVDEGLGDMADIPPHNSRGSPGFNGVLVFDQMTNSSYPNGKGGMDEPLHDLAEKQRTDSLTDSTTVNFFKDIDLADNDDEELNFR